MCCTTCLLVTCKGDTIHDKNLKFVFFCSLQNVYTLYHMAMGDDTILNLLPNDIFKYTVTLNYNQTDV